MGKSAVEFDPMALPFAELCRRVPQLRRLRSRLSVASPCSCATWFGSGEQVGIRDQLRRLLPDRGDHQVAYHYLYSRLAPCRGGCGRSKTRKVTR